VVARSSARVSSRSPANKQFDRRFNTRSYLKNQEKLDDSPRLIFKEGAIDPFSRLGKSLGKWILGGMVFGGLGYGLSYTINKTYKSGIEAIGKGQDVLTNIALINKLNNAVPNAGARIHFYASPEFVTTLINALNQPDTTESRSAKVEAVKLLSAMCEVKAMEGMILRQLDLKQFIQNFVYDGKASNATAPLVLNSKVEWINQMDKYVPEPQESLATITHKFLNKLANNPKTHDTFVQSGYIPYLATLLKANNNPDRRIAIDTIAQLTNSTAARVELAKTDVFRTLNSYLYENDELKTLKVDGKDETRATILNARLAMRQLYLSATALFYLKSNNPDWEKLVTYTKHKEISSFNSSDEQLSEAIWQQSRAIFTAGAIGLIWGTICKRLAAPTRRHSQYFRKGGVPAALGAMSLVAFYQFYLYFEGKVIKTSAIANDPILYDNTRLFTTIMASYLTIGIPLTSYALLPAFISIKNSSKWEEGYYRLVKKLQLL
jgi:hypothetical protein